MLQSPSYHTTLRQNLNIQFICENFWPNTSYLYRFPNTPTSVLLLPGFFYYASSSVSPYWFPFSPQRFSLSLRMMGWEVWTENQSITCHDWNEGWMRCRKCLMFYSNYSKKGGFFTHYGNELMEDFQQMVN